MALTATHKTRNKRLSSYYNSEMERGSTRLGTSKFVTMRSNGTPELQLLVGFLAGSLAADRGPDDAGKRFPWQREPERK